MLDVRIATTRFVACSLLICASAGTAASERSSETEQAALVDFNRRVQAYAGLHRIIEGPVATANVSADPQEVRYAMDRLAAGITRARVSPRMGDFFEPNVADIIRDVIQDSLGGPGRPLLAILERERKEGSAPLPRVHTRWPETAAPTTIPPEILANLPRLPSELQYRFVGRHLVLWDMHADLLLDVLPNAVDPLTPLLSAAGRHQSRR